MTPEGKVKALLREGLDQLGAWHFATNTHGYGRSGVMDDVACIDGLFFAFESKAHGKEPTALQLQEIEKARKAGGQIFIVIGEADVEPTLKTVERIIGRKRDRPRGKTAPDRKGVGRPRLRPDG